jgi:hypothetical protein
MRFTRYFCALMLLCLSVSFLAHGQAVVTDDANTSSVLPKSNFGSSIALIVCSGSNTYIKFSFTDLGSGVNGSNISKATLVLYVDAVLTSGTMDVYQVNGTWSEGTITWNSAPALGTKLFSAVSVSSMGYLQLDLTSTVQSWLNGTLANNGIALVPTPGSSISVSFDSSRARRGHKNTGNLRSAKSPSMPTPIPTMARVNPHPNATITADANSITTR